MATAIPAVRNGRAMSSARGYWFDWTPTRPMSPKAIARPEAREQARHIDARVGLVDHFDVDLDIGTEHLPLGAIGCDAVNSGQSIGGDQRPPPADHISIVVVMRGLDKNELKATLCSHWSD